MRDILVVLDRLGSGLGHFGHNCRALAEGLGLKRQGCLRGEDGRALLPETRKGVEMTRPGRDAGYI